MDGGAITVGERAKREERKHVLSAAVVCWCEGQNEHMMCLEWESWRRIGTEHMSDELGGGMRRWNFCRAEVTGLRGSGRRCGLFR